MKIGLERAEGCRFIAVAGNIGAGKSTLVHFVEQRFGVKPFFEPNELNPYLKDFYRDMKRWAFHSQMHFLALRLAHHQRLLEEPGVVIQDRTIYEDAEIFATNLYRSRIMSKREYESYRAMYEAIMVQLPAPDLLIYLRCSVRTARRRIRERGRPEERAIPYRYVRRIHDLYEEWLTSWDRSPTLVLESDKMDYIHDLAYRADLLQIIANTLGVNPNDKVYGRRSSR
ncbi:MAG: deoxynucleoside kinase [Pseudomonadota bacterium]